MQETSRRRRQAQQIEAVAVDALRPAPSANLCRLGIETCLGSCPDCDVQHDICVLLTRCLLSVEKRRAQRGLAFTFSLPDHRQAAVLHLYCQESRHVTIFLSTLHCWAPNPLIESGHWIATWCFSCCHGDVRPPQRSQSGCKTAIGEYLAARLLIPTQLLGTAAPSVATGKLRLAVTALTTDLPIFLLQTSWGLLPVKPDAAKRPTVEDGVEWSASRLGRFIREKSHWALLGSRLSDLQSGLDAVDGRKISCSSQESNTNSKAVQPVVNGYTDCAMQAPLDHQEPQNANTGS